MAFSANSSFTAEANAKADGLTKTLPTLVITSTGSGTGTGSSYSAAYHAALNAATTAAVTSNDLVKQTVEVLWRSLIVRFKKELKYQEVNFFLTFDEAETDYGNNEYDIYPTHAFYESYFNGYVYSDERLSDEGKGTQFGSIIANIKQSTTDTSLYDFNIQVNSSLCAVATMKAGIKDDDDITYNLSSIMTWIGYFTTTTTTAKPFESESTVNDILIGILNNTLNDKTGYSYDAMQTNLTLNTPGMSISEGASHRPKKKIILNAEYDFGEVGYSTIIAGQVYKIGVVFDTGFTSAPAP